MFLWSTSLLCTFFISIQPFLFYFNFQLSLVAYTVFAHFLSRFSQRWVEVPFIVGVLVVEENYLRCFSIFLTLLLPFSFLYIYTHKCRSRYDCEQSIIFSFQFFSVNVAAYSMNSRFFIRPYLSAVFVNNL